MEKLNDKQIVEFFRRSYRATDGLWFMKVEEKYGFDCALKLDLEVWKIVPKIQARMIKSMLHLSDTTVDLIKSLKTKLSIEGFESNLKITKNGFKIKIINCPWHNLMIKSKRTEYSKKIGTKICNVEYSVWISEFGGKFNFKIETQKCINSKYCIFSFTKN